MRNKFILLLLALAGLVAAGCSSANRHGVASSGNTGSTGDGQFHLRPCTYH